MKPASSLQSALRRLGAIISFGTAVVMVASLPAGAAVRTALTPSQQAELLPSDATVSNFGWAVDVSGTTAAAGGPFCYHNQCPGGVYIFVSAGGVWTQQAKITDPDGLASDAFGQQLSLSGNTLVVGVPIKNSAQGVAYVFTRSGSVWSQQAELTASDGAAFDHFGQSVAISGSTIVVGANRRDSSTGAAYVFTRSQGAWSQQAELTASDGVADDQFGWSVDISGSTAVVGALLRNGGTGAAYVFAQSQGVWSQAAELAASDGAAGDNFGRWVGISGASLVVGAPLRAGSTGAAYVFANTAGSWTQQGELSASDGAANDDFGWSVTIARSTVVVGAFEKGPVHQGAAYVFTRSGTAWSQRAKLTAADGEGYDLFGLSVALDRTTAVIGAPGHAPHGAAYVFVNV